MNQYDVGPTAATLTAREAAERLGVKLPTLYAYVSRGLLRSVPGEGPRTRRDRGATDPGRDLARSDRG